MNNIVSPQGPPAIEEFLSLAKEPCSNLKIVAPFITASGVRHLVQVLQDKDLQINICSRFDKRTFSQGSSDFAAFRMLAEFNEKWKVRFFKLPQLHAKIFVFDEKCLITSANLTHSGLNLNYECGLVVNQINAVDGLKEQIDRVFDKAKPILIDEISAIALSSPKNFARGFELLNKEESEEEEIVDSQDLENKPREQVVDINEINKINKVYKFLEELLEFHPEEYPFGKLKTYEIVKGQDISEVKDEVSRAVLEDLTNVKRYLNEMAESFGLPEDARDDLFYLFVKRSFINSFCQDLKPPTHMYYKVYGKKILELFLANRLMRNNILWMEDVKYYYDSISHMESWITPRFILEEFGARWCLAFGDLSVDWEFDQALNILGIISFHNPQILWRGLTKFIDSSSLYIRGVSFSLDYKSVLQEASQEYNSQLPTYTVSSETGPDHEKEFSVKVKAFGEEVVGLGSSKQLGEKNAAKELLEKLKRIGKITPNDTVITRKGKKDMKPYVLTDEFSERLNDFKLYFKFSLPDKLIDCALTTTDERNKNRNRRSNEKLSYMGSLLREIMSARYQIVNLNPDAKGAINITKKQFVDNFMRSSSEINHLVKKYYKDVNMNTLADLFSSIIALIWFDSRWDGLLKYSELFKIEASEFERTNSTVYLQEIIQKKSIELPEYKYVNKGQDHEKRFQCQVTWKGKVLAKSGWLVSKKEARREAANVAIDFLKENPSFLVEEKGSDSD